MNSSRTPWVRLSLEIDSVAIEPRNRDELGCHRLPIGTMVEDPEGALIRAIRSRSCVVRVRVKDREGRIALEVVSVADLCDAAGVRSRGLGMTSALAPSSRPALREKSAG